MQTLHYETKRIKQYELEIWQSESCKYLAPIKVYENTIMWQTEGCQNIKDFLRISRNDPVNVRMFKLFYVTRKIVEAVSSATDYLIDENSISLDPKKLWLRGDTHEVLLLPEKSSGDFFSRLCRLLHQLDGDIIANRIEACDRKSAFSYKTLLSFLSQWELEIR